MTKPEETSEPRVTLQADEIMATMGPALEEIAGVWLRSNTRKKHAAILIEVEGEGFFNFVDEVEKVINELENIAPGMPEQLKAALRDDIPGGGPHRLSVYVNTPKGMGVAQLNAAIISVRPRVANPVLN